MYVCKNRNISLWLILFFFFFFFLVLCLPRQVRTSNGAIHHDLQLSPSTCCNPLSAYSPVTSFLVFLSSFSLPFFPGREKEERKTKNYGELCFANLKVLSSNVVLDLSIELPLYSLFIIIECFGMV